MSPAHEHSCGGAGKRVDVADLGHEHGGEDRANAGDGLDGLVAGMVGQNVGDQGRETVDLDAERVDQAKQRVDPKAVGVAKATSSSRDRRPTPKRLVTGTATPSLAKMACTWALSPERTADQLGAVADQFSQLA